MPIAMQNNLDFETINTLCVPFKIVNYKENLTNGKNEVITVSVEKEDSKSILGVMKFYNNKEIVDKEVFIYKTFGKCKVSPELILSQTTKLPYFHITKKVEGYQHLIVDDMDIWEEFIDKVKQLHDYPVCIDGALPNNLKKLFQFGQGFLGEETLLIQNLRDLYSKYCTPEEKLLIKCYEEKKHCSFDSIICDISHKLSQIKQKSLLHGDLHRWNVIQKKTDTDIEVLLVDWEFCGYGPSQLDFGSYFYDDIDKWITATPTGGIITGDFSRKLLMMYYDKTKDKTGLTIDQFIHNQRICNCYRSFALCFILQTYELDKYFSIDLLKVALHLYFDFLEDK